MSTETQSLETDSKPELEYSGLSDLRLAWVMGSLCAMIGGLIVGLALSSPAFLEGVPGAVFGMVGTGFAVVGTIASYTLFAVDYAEVIDELRGMESRTES